MQDRYGLELSTASEVARDAYVEGVDRMLAADAGVEARLGAAVDADPDFALAHIALARQHHLNARGGEARDTVERAVELASGASEREQRHVDILSKVIGGRIPESLELTKEHVAEHPRDAFVLAPSCGVFGSIGFSGRVGREPEQLERIEPLAAHYGDDWWFLTVHAFALVEMGEWERGREMAYRSLEQRPSNSHAAHTLIHALFEGGADAEALGFLGDWIPESDRGSLLHCHNWWHYALLLMTTDRTDDAWEAFRSNCLPGTTESPSINVFTDSSSFLWRWELAGNPRDDATWQTVREYYEESFRRPIVFVDSHAALAYAALGETDQLQATIDVLQELGEAGKLPAEATAASLSRAYAAFASERWSEVIDQLEPLLPQVVRIGGSRAQRDLVTNTLLAAYVRADRPDDARAFLAGVQDRQPSRPVAGLAA